MTRLLVFLFLGGQGLLIHFQQSQITFLMQFFGLSAFLFGAVAISFCRI